MSTGVDNMLPCTLSTTYCVHGYRNLLLNNSAKVHVLIAHTVQVVE